MPSKATSLHIPNAVRYGERATGANATSRSRTLFFPVAAHQAYKEEPGRPLRGLIYQGLRSFRAPCLYVGFGAFPLTHRKHTALPRLVLALLTNGAKRVVPPRLPPLLLLLNHLPHAGTQVIRGREDAASEAYEVVQQL
jgi:hypothetical protein